MASTLRDVFAELQLLLPGDSYRNLLLPTRNLEYLVPPRTSFLSIIPEAPAALAFLSESASTSEFWVGTKSSSLVKMKSPCWDIQGRLFMFLTMSVSGYFSQLCFFSPKTLHQHNLLNPSLFLTTPFPTKPTYYMLLKPSPWKGCQNYQSSPGLQSHLQKPPHV